MDNEPTISRHVRLSNRSRMARMLGRAMQMPGMAPTFQAFVGLRVLTLVHRGRKSGTLHKTPLSILAEKPEQGEVFVSPMFGRDADWYRNVIADGVVEAHVRGEKWQVEWHELDGTEGRSVGEAFRTAHPIYGRIILWVIARLNGFEGDPAEAALQNLPMLGLRRVAT